MPALSHAAASGSDLRLSATAQPAADRAQEPLNLSAVVKSAVAVNTKFTMGYSERTDGAQEKKS